MKLTNNHNLPDPIINAIKGFEQDYKDGRGETDFSTTELIKDELQVRLLRLHRDEIEEDASGRLWILLGQSMHKLLETSNSKSDIVEERFFFEVDGSRVSGQADLVNLASGTLTDYKCTSVWSVIRGIKPEWRAQLNILSYLASQKGYKIEKLQVCAILRDWQISKSTSGGNYPKVGIVTLDIEKSNPVVALKYIKDRVRVHKEAQDKAPEDLPKCKDTWGGKKCNDYCNVAKWCPYVK